MYQWIPKLKRNYTFLFSTSKQKTHVLLTRIVDTKLPPELCAGHPHELLFYEQSRQTPYWSFAFHSKYLKSRVLWIIVLVSNDRENCLDFIVLSKRSPQIKGLFLRFLAKFTVGVLLKIICEHFTENPVNTPRQNSRKKSHLKWADWEQRCSHRRRVHCRHK